MGHQVRLVGFIVDADTPQKADEILKRALPEIRDTVEPIDGWWIAEDDRTDGSDNDSAVFVFVGSQEDSYRLLLANGLSGSYNIKKEGDDGGS